MNEIIYKFFHPERTGFFKKTNGTIEAGFFPGLSIAATSLRCLNDPFECDMEIIADDKKLIARLMSTKGFIEEQGFRKSRGLASDKKTVKNALRERIKDIRSGRESKEERIRSFFDFWGQQADNSIRIMSLSQAPESLLMWAHYTKDHKGFAVGFKNDFLAQEERNIKSKGWGLKEVIYEYQKPRFNIDDSESYNSPLPYYTKSKCWEYEKEVRFVGLTNYSPIPLVSPPDDMLINIINIKPEFVDSVIFGSRMNAKISKEIVEFCKTRSDLAHVKFIQAMRSAIEYKIEFKPYRH